MEIVKLVAGFVILFIVVLPVELTKLELAANNPRKAFEFTLVGLVMVFCAAYLMFSALFQLGMGM